ncbi:MAG: PilZ domain-containing protein [Desulfobacterales bacterium]|nr:PilZ domain-containing protein [Desulfobacterales bacterium]
MNSTKHSKTIKRKGKKMPSKKGVVTIERRKHPRFNLELPLDYFRLEVKENYGGIVTNASELGILVYLPEKMEIGTTLSIEIFYAKGLELDSIKAIAKVVWADLAARKTWGEHRYGLQFQSIDKKNLNKLKNLFKEAGSAKKQKS